MHTWHKLGQQLALQLGFMHDIMDDAQKYVVGQQRHQQQEKQHPRNRSRSTSMTHNQVAAEVLRCHLPP